MHMWPAETWMQYSASHVATTALLMSQNGLRSNLRASDFQTFPGRACPQTPLVLHAYAQIRHLCNLPSKILATGLHSQSFQIASVLWALLCLELLFHQLSFHVLQ